MPSFAQNQPHQVVCGFVPSVLSRPVPAMQAMARAAGNAPQKKRADINNICISMNSTLKETISQAPPSTKRVNPTKNRKYITHSDTVEHEGKRYLINANKSGIYTAILHKAIQQLDACLRRWQRVLVVRFDLHHKGIQTHSNKWLSKFIKNLKRRLERAYGLAELGFIWAREQEKGKAQHYHMAIFLDGDVVRHPAKLTNIIKETWISINPVNTVYYPVNNYYFVQNEETKQEAIYRLSYLAKARCKGYRAAQVKDYQCSRLK